MRFKKVGFKNFRNLENTSIDIPYDQIILTGYNGQGKTNFLEALYILCYGSSFRTKNFKDLVRHGEKNFSLFVEDGEQKIEMIYENQKKRIIIDGNEIKDRRELIYKIPCIVFSHGDIEIIRGEPENRRRFFDQLLCMYDLLYFDDLRRYKKILRQRNMAIKNQQFSIISIYDQKLAEYGQNIMKKRKKAVESFNEILPSLFKTISHTEIDLKIKYKASWDVDGGIIEICKKLENTLETDLRLMTTTTGPHRDRFIIMNGDKNFVAYASTGQIRLASLIFRSAQLDFYKKKTEKDPVILVDDVLLEMDYKKRERYLDSLSSYSQAFFTFLPEEKYQSDEEKNTLFLGVNDGRFSLNE